MGKIQSIHLKARQQDKIYCNKERRCLKLRNMQETLVLCLMVRVLLQLLKGIHWMSVVNDTCIFY